MHVKLFDVNAYLLPTKSEVSPNLVRQFYFCTFADVKERPKIWTVAKTPYTEGRGATNSYTTKQYGKK